MTENVYSKCWLSELGWDGKETNPFPWPGLRVASQWIWWISDQLTTIAPLWDVIDHCNWHRYQTTHSEYLSYLSSDQRMDKPLNPFRCTIWMILIWSTFSWNFSWCLSNPSNNKWTEALNFCYIFIFTKFWCFLNVIQASVSFWYDKVSANTASWFPKCYKNPTGHRMQVEGPQMCQINRWNNSSQIDSLTRKIDYVQK